MTRGTDEPLPTSTWHVKVFFPPASRDPHPGASGLLSHSSSIVLRASSCSIRHASVFFLLEHGTCCGPFQVSLWTPTTSRNRLRAPTHSLQQEHFWRPTSRPSRSACLGSHTVLQRLGSRSPHLQSTLPPSLQGLTLTLNVPTFPQ